MAQIFGGKSEYLVKNERKSLSIAGAVVAVYFIAIGLYYLFFHKLNFFSPDVLSFTFALIFLAVVLKIIFEQYLSVFDRFNNGRRGEEQIFAELKRLPDDYSVFYNLKLPGAWWNIDFAVAGPTGLFVVEVKSHGGKITYIGEKLVRNGRDFEKGKNFLKQTMGGALDLRGFLRRRTGKDYFITPILVFSNKWASVNFGFQPVNNIYVLGKLYLNRLIEGNNRPLSQSDIDLISKELMQLVQKVEK